VIHNLIVGVLTLVLFYIHKWLGRIQLGMDQGNIDLLD